MKVSANASPALPDPVVPAPSERTATAAELSIDDIATIDVREPARFHRVLDNDRKHTGKRRLSTFDDVASEQLRVYRATRRGKLSLAQGKILIEMLKTIAATLALARFPVNVELPSPGGPSAPATLPELTAILEAIESEQAEGRAPTPMPDGSILSAPVRHEAEGHGSPLAAGPVPGSPSES